MPVHCIIFGATAQRKLCGQFCAVSARAARDGTALSLRDGRLRASDALLKGVSGGGPRGSTRSPVCRIQMKRRGAGGGTAALEGGRKGGPGGTTACETSADFFLPQRRAPREKGRSDSGEARFDSVSTEMGSAGVRPPRTRTPIVTRRQKHSRRQRSFGPYLQQHVDCQTNLCQVQDMQA